MIDILRCRNAFIIFIFLTIPLGCAPTHKISDPGLDKKAGTIVRNIRQANQDIHASKGVGWIKTLNGRHTQKYKIAWAAAFPNKIRITFLVSGHPFETIAADGKKVTFVSHTGNHKPYTTHTRDPDMEEFINIPVKLSELISLLLGRLPVKKYDTAVFSPNDPALKTIHLTRLWSNTRQTLFLDDTNSPAGLKTSTLENQLLYSLKITSNKTISSHIIPATIEMIDGGQNRLSLKITTFQVNPRIKETVFRLTVKGS